jgi:hypothetical protein
VISAFISSSEKLPTVMLIGNAICTSAAKQRLCKLETIQQPILGHRSVGTLKNAVFWDVTPCGSCKSRRFGGTWRLHHHGDKNRHGVTFQKTAFFTVTTVKTSNLTYGYAVSSVTRTCNNGWELYVWYVPEVTSSSVVQRRV